MSSAEPIRYMHTAPVFHLGDSGWSAEKTYESFKTKSDVDSAVWLALVVKSSHVFSAIRYFAWSPCVIRLPHEVPGSRENIRKYVGEPEGTQ